MSRRTESEVCAGRECIIRRVVGKAVGAEEVREVRQRMANGGHFPTTWHDQRIEPLLDHGIGGIVSLEEVTYSRMPITRGSVW